MQAGADQTRYLGIQWRLAASYLAVGLVASALVAGALGLALVAGFSPERLIAVALAASLMGTLAATVPGLWFARRLKGRLRAVSQFAAALAAGNLAHRLEPDGSDEIGQLEQQLNDMADRLAEAMATLRELAERNRDLAYEAGALAERTRLARDLHDTVNQELFSLALMAATARRRLEQGAVAGLAGDLQEIEELARHAHGTVRELILRLRPPRLEQEGLGAALREYVAAFAARHGVAATCRAEVPRLPFRVEEALLRMAQEALHNVAKHAGATRVEVEVTARDGWVRLRVQDDGRGFDPAGPVRPTAMGLAGLRERAAALGGRLAVRSAPGRGTVVIAEVPAQPNAGEEDADAGTHPGGDRR